MKCSSFNLVAIFSTVVAASSSDAFQYECTGNAHYFINDKVEFEQFTGVTPPSFNLAESEMTLPNGRALSVDFREDKLGNLFAVTNEGAVSISDVFGELNFTWTIGPSTVIGSCIDIGFYQELRENAENGNPDAQYGLYKEIRYGRWGWEKLDGKAEREAESIEWLKLAADQGHADAQVGLANYIGRSDPETFERLIQSAAEQNNMRAIASLATYLGLRQGAYETAARWLLRDATTYPIEEDDRQYQKMVQHNLGVHYLRGNGVPQNYSTAYIWFLVADTWPKDVIDEAIKNLSPEAISMAKAEAVLCTQSNFADCG